MVTHEGLSGGAPVGVGTLAARLADTDRRRFVGRAAELEFLERRLHPDGPVRVILVRGAGGIGKSSLLRELGRRARARGIDTFFVEGRERSSVGMSSPH